MVNRPSRKFCSQRENGISRFFFNFETVQNGPFCTEISGSFATRSLNTYVHIDCYLNESWAIEMTNCE